MGDMLNELTFKIDFLRAMTSIMTEPDLDIFTNICKHYIEGTAVLADLFLLDQLYKKFEKSEGGKSAATIPEIETRKASERSEPKAHSEGDLEG